MTSPTSATDTSTWSMTGQRPGRRGSASAASRVSCTPWCASPASPATGASTSPAPSTVTRQAKETWSSNGSSHEAEGHVHPDLVVVVTVARGRDQGVGVAGLGGEDDHSLVLAPAVSAAQLDDLPVREVEVHQHKGRRLHETFTDRTTPGRTERTCTDGRDLRDEDTEVDRPGAGRPRTAGRELENR